MIFLSQPTFPLQDAKLCLPLLKKTTELKGKKFSQGANIKQSASLDLLSRF